MFDLIRNTLFNTNKYSISGAKYVDDVLHQIELDVQHHPIEKIPLIDWVNELWEAFDAIPEPTADDLALLQKNIAQVVEVKSDDLAVLTKFKFV